LLDRLLADQAWLWRPQPFKEARPPWCQRLPGLTAQLLSLNDEEILALGADDGALRDLLLEHLPCLGEVQGIFDRLSLRPVPSMVADTPDSLGWAVPGRKWRQVQQFAAALGPLRAPPLDWCGGKGHLGRFLAHRWGMPAWTLERDEALCRQGEDLARRAGVPHQFAVQNVLAPEAAGHLVGCHPVALHACGELHRQLLHRAVAVQVPALAVAPCCYHHGVTDRYPSLSGRGQLQLFRDDLRLAVTETRTAVDREVRLRDREMAWKLGYDQLRRQVTGEDRYRPIRPIDKAWLRSGFPDFCQALALRDGLCLPESTDWSRFEAEGWRRQRETMRLSLVRQAFRRPLELWLVLDLAGYLEQHGYGVELSEFCDPQLSPRNLLLRARRLGADPLMAAL
jgi:hypothetical protein